MNFYPNPDGPANIEINDILRVNGVIADYRMAWIVAGSTC
jgi:hypothetical protein